MSSRTIEIIVETNGSTRVQTRGFTGSACREASQFIEEALGKRQRTGHAGVLSGC